MTEEEAITCTRLFVEHIAGVDWEDENVFDKVGRNCNGVGEKPLNDGGTFWKKIHEIIPEFLTEDEAKWLQNADIDGQGAFELLCQLDFNHPSALEPSALISNIWYWK